MIKYKDTHSIVIRELDRIEKKTGDRPEDWMAENEEEAYNDWILGNDEDIDSFEQSIVNRADSYIDFIKENYPEQMRT